MAILGVGIPRSYNKRVISLQEVHSNHQFLWWEVLSQSTLETWPPATNKQLWTVTQMPTWPPEALEIHPELLAEYNQIIQDQLCRGIIEVVDLPSVTQNQVYCLPHHCVLRHDKATTKQRIVNDASAKTTGPSLNDCLYSGHTFGQSILGILLRFCVHRVALAWDMKKFFLMISIDPRDRLFEIPVDLKHCWGHAWDYRVQVYPNFFRVKSSPFLLNATINHHIEQYWTVDPEFVDKFLSSVYVDDVSICVDSVESTYQLYLESKLEAGFTLRKFITNSPELWHRIQLNKHTSRSIGTESPESPERDESYICYVFSWWPQYR